MHVITICGRLGDTVWNRNPMPWNQVNIGGEWTSASCPAISHLEELVSLSRNRWRRGELCQVCLWETPHFNSWLHLDVHDNAVRGGIYPGKHDVHYTMLLKCWANVYDVGPAFKQHWVSLSCYGDSSWPTGVSMPLDDRSGTTSYDVTRPVTAKRQHLMSRCVLEFHDDCEMNK